MSICFIAITVINKASKKSVETCKNSNRNNPIISDTKEPTVPGAFGLSPENPTVKKNLLKFTLIPYFFFSISSFFLFSQSDFLEIPSFFDNSVSGYLF